MALFALGWLFHAVPIGQLGTALQKVSIPTFLLFVAVLVALILTADSAATWATFRYCLPDVPLRFGETLMIRGATYLLALVNYGLGQGGIAYFVHKRHTVSIGRVAGAVALIMGVNLILIAAISAAGIAVGGAPSQPFLWLLVVGLGVILPPCYLGVILLRPRFLLGLPILRPLFDAGVRGHLVAAAARLPHVALLLVGHYVAMRFFGVNPGIGRALSLLPILFLAGAIPVSPLGLGTTQATAIFLFSPYAVGTAVEREACVAAYSLSLQFLMLIYDALIGLVFLPRLTRADKISAA